MKRFMFPVTFLLLYIAAVTGTMFPKECVQNVKAFPVPCCPSYLGTPCGSGLNRGSCMAAVSSRADVPPTDMKEDDRNMTNPFYFNMTCKCKSNYYGPSCGECAFGWTGDTCGTPYTITRQNIEKMTPLQVERFLSVLHYCKTKIDPEFVILKAADRFRRRSFRFIRGSYFDVMAFGHYYATKPYNKDGQEIYITNYAHRSTGFITWHRYFLMVFERQLQKCIKDSTFAIPYFKWESSPNCTMCNDNYLGSTNEEGKINMMSVFYVWRIICGLDYDQTVCLTEDCECERARIVRMPGLQTSSPPTEADINYCLSLTALDQYPYDWTANGFRNCLERVHDHYHLYIGGGMTQLYVAAADPLFLLIHVNCDRIADQFIVQRGLSSASYPADNTVYGHMANDCIMPFCPCVRHKTMLQPNWVFGIAYN